MKRSICKTMVVTIGVSLLLPVICWGQVNSGSNGSDGEFNPTTNTVINMADHPNGIYQYTSVNIPYGITVTFIPNANNSPVTWLVQSNVVISGTIDISGKNGFNSTGGQGGPGGGRGGDGGSNPTDGQGLGGGKTIEGYGGNASFGTTGQVHGVVMPLPVYGNQFLIPMIGGSGGGGAPGYNGAGGGGGAILIAASESIQFDYLNSKIVADGGNQYYNNGSAGGGVGSGGAVRLVTANFGGSGRIYATSGGGGGDGRIRIDALQNTFGGFIFGALTQGYQPIIIPVAGQGVQLFIASVAGASVSTTPSGQPVPPDASISSQQTNPIPVVVHCSNLPLNTQITVTVKPASGSSVNATGYNTTGTLTSSTATISIVMPRGGGIIYATAATSN